MKKIIVGIGTLWGILFIFALPLFALDNEEPPEFLLFGKQEKVVTAGKYEQEKAEIAVSMEIFTAEDIKDFGWLTLADVLRFLSRWEIRSAGSKLHLTDSRLLCLVDGRPTDSPVSAGIFSYYPNLPLTNVERIEIILGPASAIYGANAFTGVVNIITKSAEDIDGLTFSVAGGNFASQFYRLNWDKEGEELDILFAADFYKTNGEKLYVGNTFYEDYNFLGKIVFADFTLLLGHRRISRGLPGPIDNITPDNKEEIREIFVHGIRDVEINDKINLLIRGYVNKRNHIMEMVNIEDIKENSVGMNIQNNWQITPENLFIFGLDYRYDGATAVVLGGKREVTNIAVYLQNKLKPIEELTFTMGTRYDNHSKYKNESSPQIGIAYNLYRTILRASYGEGFRAPDFFEVYGDMWYSSRRRAVGNENLIPERKAIFELGVGHKFARVLEGEVILFTQKIENLIVSRTNFVGSVWQFDKINKNEAEIEGIELKVGSEYYNWKGYLSYVYQETRDREAGRELDYIPRNKLNLGVKHRINDDIRVNANIYCVDQRKYSVSSLRMDRLAAYAIVDSRVMAKLRENINLSFSVYNIFDTKYEEIKDYPTIGRNFFIEVGYTF